MSIPLDRLYNYLDDLNNRDILIYRFFPHGSKKLKDLNKVHSYDHLTPLELDLTPIMICHDQEPLDFSLYETLSTNDVHVSDSVRSYMPGFPDHQIFKKFSDSIPRIRLGITDVFNFNDKLLLCHSEKNSKELEKFSKDYIGVYYWSHAIIARDWFRYAQYDPALKLSQTYKHDFLIYNRAWQGTREYRLKFVELLVNNQLHKSCLTSFSPIDDNKHYTTHTFKNPNLAINATDFEEHFPMNTHSSCASADYNNSDYNLCGIEIILETLFDDTRLHLTEKTLRPIACGKPFMLAATAGSLQYLRDYGFETYHSYINEEYDTIVDPIDRLNAIIKEMNRISSLPIEQKINLWANLNQIAQRNKELFFSDSWQQQIVNEYIHNCNLALQECRKYCKGKWRIEGSAILDANGITPPFPLSDQTRKILSGQAPV